MVPRLTTALSGPVLDIERRFLDAMPDIERWLRGMRRLRQKTVALVAAATGSKS